MSDPLHVYLVVRERVAYVALAATEPAAVAMRPDGGAVVLVEEFAIAINGGGAPGVVLSAARVSSGTG